MGYDALYFGRIDYQDKTTRLNEKTMEMIWKGSPENIGESGRKGRGACMMFDTVVCTTTAC